MFGIVIGKGKGVGVFVYCMNVYVMTTYGLDDMVYLSVCKL